KSHANPQSELRSLARREVLFLRALIPIDPHIPRLSPNRDDVDARVAVQVGGGHVFDADAAFIDDLPRPLSAFVVLHFVDAYAGAVLRRELGAGAADADDQLVRAVAVEICAPYGLAPAQFLVDHMAVPQLVGVGRLGVDNDLIAVPGFNRGDELAAV